MGLIALKLDFHGLTHRRHDINDEGARIPGSTVLKRLQATATCVLKLDEILARRFHNHSLCSSSAGHIPLVPLLDVQL